MSKPPIKLSDSLYFRVDPVGCVSLSETSDFGSSVEIDRGELDKLLPLLTLVTEFVDPWKTP